MFIGAAATKATGAEVIPNTADYNTFLFGSSKYIDGGNDSSVQLTKEFTASIWVYPTTTSTDQTLFSKYETNTNDRAWQMEIGNSSDPTKWRVTLSSDGSSQVALNSSSSVTLDEFTMFTLVYDGTLINIYLNGSLDSTVAYTGAVYHASTASINIGALNDGGANLFNGGSLTTPFLSPTVFNAQDIEDLYNEGSVYNYNALPTKFKTSAALFYDMNSNDNTLTDKTVNGNDGTGFNSISSDGEITEFTIS